MGAESAINTHLVEQSADGGETWEPLLYGFYAKGLAYRFAVAMENRPDNQSRDVPYRYRVKPPHSTYPHVAGTRYDCAACETRCHCAELCGCVTCVHCAIDKGLSAD